MKTLLTFCVAVVLLSQSVSLAATVELTLKPRALVHGKLPVPVTVSPEVERVELLVNGVRQAEKRGRSMVFTLDLGHYIRRLRIRAVGYDAAGAVVGEDEMVVNDPRPPFRVRLQAPKDLPAEGPAELSATVIAPESLPVAGVDFYLGETKLGSDQQAPYSASFDPSLFQAVTYARVAARAADGTEASDVRFFGSVASDQIEVSLQQIPLSAAGGLPIDPRDLRLIDDGAERSIEGILSASDQPLQLILLIDSSESMLQELPVVKAAARQFVGSLLRPADRVAIVRFSERTVWLTGFTDDRDAVARALEEIRPRGETHLYDSIIDMLFELQKRPGRHALVVLTDGVDQGSQFTLDNVIHYAKYAGVPIYPIIKNRMLSRLMRFGIGRLEVRRLARIARDTGASYFIIQKESELPRVYEQIAAELRQQYSLLFYSDPGGQDRWHPIAVESRSRRALRVPRGYFP